MGFQTQVNVQPAPGVEGEFASTNPRDFFLAGPGGLVAGPAGAVVGRFGWVSYLQIDANNAPATVNNFGSGPVSGFVHRAQQALITAYLAESSMTINAGENMDLVTNADLWVKNRGATAVQVGMKCYASYADGSASFAATGSASTASGSASSIAAETSSFTGSISDNLMTVTAVGSGTIYAGTTISGTGVTSNTIIGGQVLPLIAGEALGGIGRYYVNFPEQTVASTTISGTYGQLTVGGTVVGAFGVGDTLTGSGVAAGTAITAQINATTFVVNNNTVVGSTAITAATNVETKWFAATPGAVGDIIKITANPLG